MKLALDGINSERARLKPKVVSERVRLPGMRPTQKQRYVAYDRKMGGLAPVFGNKISATEWSFHPPPIPRSESSSGAKRKPTIFTPRRRNTALAVPTKHLNTRATQIKQAPRSLIEEHRRPQEPSALKRKEPPTPIAPGRSRQQAASTASSPTATNNASSRKEVRRRTLTSNKPAPSPSQSTNNTRKEASSPSKMTSSSATNCNLKRPAISPPPIESRGQSQPSPPLSNCGGTSPVKSDQPSTYTARPPTRKRPAPSIFIQPKRKRVS